MKKTIGLIKYIFFFTIILFLFFLTTFDFILPLFVKNINSVFFNEPEKDWRLYHNIYHHDIRKKREVKLVWGATGESYIVCSDLNGFKSKCNNNKKIKNYDYAFIGDSFVEGIGLKYEDTFVGILADKYKNLNIANLGVSSYGHSIYYSKIKYLLNSGYKFNHLVLVPDISDIQDEAVYYKLCGDIVISRTTNNCEIAKNKKFKWKLKHLTSKYAPQTFKLYYHAMGFLKNPSKYIYNLFEKKPYVFEKFNFDHPRGEWTYNPKSKFYGEGVRSAVQTTLQISEKLYELLENNNIKLSVIVYPWPNQIRHDINKNNHYKMWEKFCKSRCYMFVNTGDYFFKSKNELGAKKTYDKYYFKGDVHFNIAGNKILSEFASKIITTN